MKDERFLDTLSCFLLSNSTNSTVMSQGYSKDPGGWRWPQCGDLLEQGFLSFNVHTNHVLKCRFWFSRSGMGLKVCISNQFFYSRYYTLSSKKMNPRPIIPKVLHSYSLFSRDVWTLKQEMEGSRESEYMATVAFWTIKIWAIVDSNPLPIFQNQTENKPKKWIKLKAGSFRR